MITPLESHRQVASLMSELMRGQGTRTELSDRTGLDRKFISRMLAALKEQDCVYTIGWSRDKTGRQQQAVFSLGHGDDAPRPLPQTQAERDAKRYRKRKQSERVTLVKTRFIGANPWLQNNCH